MTRPITTAPPGRLTLAEAALASGLSYQEVHRRCAAGKLPSARQDSSLTWSICAADLKLLMRRTAAANPRKAYQLRTPRDGARAKAWERAAKKRNTSVSLLAAQLMDEISGWKP